MARYRPEATPRTILPVGVGASSPSPIGVVGLTQTASRPSAAASRTSCSASSFVRLYGTVSSHDGGWSASVAKRPATGPQVPAVLVCTSLRTPAARQAAITFRVPSTFTARRSGSGAL